MITKCIKEVFEDGNYFIGFLLIILLISVLLAMGILVYIVIGICNGTIEITSSSSDSWWALWSINPANPASPFHHIGY